MLDKTRSVVAPGNFINSYLRIDATLEEALQVRMDFRWLVEGRSIDHTTISEFRRKHADALKQTFVQIALVAREIGCLPLQKLAFDGTRIRSNNRRRGTRTPAELREMKQALTEKVTELEAKAAATATVDVDSGIIVDADVLSVLNEDKQLVPSVLAVQENFELETPSPEVLADGLMTTGENLAACEAAGTELFSPAKSQIAKNDRTEPVADADHDRLPTRTVGRQGETSEQLDKQAFVYDSQRNCYWCPQGKSLEYKTTISQTRNQTTRVRDRYQSDGKVCADCPLKFQKNQTLCLSGKSKTRQVHREQHESLHETHAAKMATAEAQQKYAGRRHVGERPFAVIKQNSHQAKNRSPPVPAAWP